MAGIVVPFAVVCFGLLIAAAILSRGKRIVDVDWICALAFAPGIGCGSISLALFFLLYFDLGKSLLWLPLLACGGAAIGFLSRRPREAPHSAIDQAAVLSRDVVPFQPSRTLRYVNWLVAAALVYLFAGVAWEANRISPWGTFDGVAIWNAHALFLFRPSANHAELFGSLIRGHPEYPLLLPGAVAGQFEVWGIEDPIIPQGTALAFLVGLTLMIFSGVADLGSRKAAFPAVLFMLSTPAISHFSLTQSADVAVAYFALGAALGLWSQLPRAGSGEFGGCPPVLAGLFVGLVAWTKNEGVVLSFMLVAAYLCCLILEHRGAGGGRSFFRVNLRRWMAMAAGAFPSYLALFLFRMDWVSTREARSFLRDIPSKLADVDRWEAIGRVFLCRLSPLCEPDRWGAFWLFCIVAGAFIFWKLELTWRHRFLVMAFVLGLGVYLSFYLITPNDVVWHLNSSLDRLLLQLTPMLAVWVFGAWRPSGSAQ